MKIIFLDNDGVICLSGNWGSRYKKAREYMGENGINEHDPEMYHPDKRPIPIRFDNFDQKAVKVLNEILEKTGAEIVVSSDWKLFATVEELGEYYTLQGISKKPIDRTLNMSEFDEKGGTMFEYNGWRDRMRIVEIKKYLEDHPEITHWVAIDDMNMSNDVQQGYGLDNFVHTRFSDQGIKQSGIKEKILKFFE